MYRSGSSATQSVSARCQSGCTSARRDRGARSRRLSPHPTAGSCRPRSRRPGGRRQHAQRGDQLACPSRVRVSLERLSIRAQGTLSPRSGGTWRITQSSSVAASTAMTQREQDGAPDWPATLFRSNLEPTVGLVTWSAQIMYCVRVMSPEHSKDRRQFAAECLELARQSTEPNISVLASRSWATGSIVEPAKALRCNRHNHQHRMRSLLRL